MDKGRNPGKVCSEMSDIVANVIAVKAHCNRNRCCKSAIIAVTAHYNRNRGVVISLSLPCYRIRGIVRAPSSPTC